MKKEIDLNPKEFIMTIMNQAKQRIEKLKGKESENFLEVTYNLKVLALIDFLVTSGRNHLIDIQELTGVLSKIGDVTFSEEQKLKNMDVRMPDGTPYLDSQFVKMRQMAKVDCLGSLANFYSACERRKKLSQTACLLMFEVGDIEKKAMERKSKSVDITDILNKMKSGE